MKKNTSWKKELVWGEYQKDLILPNILRLLDIKTGEVVLDLGCGAGLFSKEFAKKSGRVIGVDLSPELIELAKKNVPGAEFFNGSADNLSFLKAGVADKITIILAIQNIDNVHKVFAECRRTLKPDGRIYLVINHPAFRVPKASDWGWDSENKIQYRRIDAYMSESKVKIQTHPGNRPQDYTISFHRPLQFYFKLLSKGGFCISRLEEWVSHKESKPGPRAKAENFARKEIPLFLFLEAEKQAE